MSGIANTKHPIVGYMGYVPSAEQGEDNQTTNIESHIPGYVGYIPSVKSENLYAKTYGKITENCAKGELIKGMEFSPEHKYKTTTQETYGDPNLIKQE